MYYVSYNYLAPRILSLKRITTGILYDKFDFTEQVITYLLDYIYILLVHNGVYKATVLNQRKAYTVSFLHSYFMLDTLAFSLMY